MRSTAARLLVAGLLVVHGLAHWELPTMWGTRAEATPTLLPAATGVATALWTATLVMLVTAGIALATRRAFWRPLAIAGGALSLVTLALFWDGVLLYGLLIDAALVVGLLLPATHARFAAIVRVGTRRAVAA